MELRMLSVNQSNIAVLLMCVAGCGAAPEKVAAFPPTSPPGATEAPPVPEVEPAEPVSGSLEEEVAKPRISEGSDGNETLDEPVSVAVDAPAEPVGPAPLPSGTTVLHIGDSFAGALGVDLNHELEAEGIRGILKYETATYIPTWAWRKDLDKLFRKWRPDLVIITLGANELEVPKPEDRAETIRRLVGRMHDTPCVWVAPPLWEDARGALLEVIRQNVGPCVYLDSDALVPGLARARDGIHPTLSARKHWAREVVRWLAAHRDPSGAQPWSLREESPWSVD